jgi:hypothetical protein
MYEVFARFSISKGRDIPRHMEYDIEVEQK